MNKPVLLVGAGALLLGALGAGGMYLNSSMSAKRQARKQIDAFGKQWVSVRTCLFGEHPRAEDPVQALLARELTDPQGAIGLNTCAALANKLKRPPGDNSGDDTIEADWLRLRRSSAELGVSLNWLTSAAPNKSIVELRAEVADKAKKFEADYAQLRKHAGMKPLEAATPLASAVIPVAGEGTLVQIGGNDPIVMDRLERYGDQLYVLGDTGGGPAEAVVSGPAKIAAVYLGGAVRAAPSGANWGAWVDGPTEDNPKAKEFVLHAGELGAGGDPVGSADGGAAGAAKAGVVVVRLPVPPPEPASVEDPYAEQSAPTMAVIGAIGTGAERAIVYDLSTAAFDKRWVATSHDTGATWSSLELPSEPNTAFVVDPRGRIDAIWTSEDGVVRWLPIDAATLPLVPEAVIVGSGDGYGGGGGGGGRCLSANRVWWNLDSGLVWTPKSGGVVTKIDGTPFNSSDLLCDDSALVGIRLDGGKGFAVAQRCDAVGCKDALAVPVAARANAAFALSARQGLVAVVHTDGYIVLWRSGKDGAEGTPVMRLPNGVQVRALIEWDGALHLIVTDDKSLVRIVPLPPA